MHLFCISANSCLASSRKGANKHKDWDLETEVQRERERLRAASHHPGPLWAHLWSKPPQSLGDGGSTWRAGEAALLWSYSKTSCTAGREERPCQFNISTSWTETVSQNEREKWYRKAVTTISTLPFLWCGLWTGSMFLFSVLFRDFMTRNGGGAYRFLDDVEALLIYLKGGHLFDDLLEQDVLFVIVAFNRQLQQTVTEDRWCIISAVVLLTDLWILNVWLSAVIAG